MIERWRYRCPECDSSAISPLARSDGYFCKVCSSSGFEPVDKKQESTA